jgi:microcin C transport system substrate-binding protein
MPLGARQSVLKRWRARAAVGFALVLMVLTSTGARAAGEGYRHGLSLFGPLKYEAGFAHFAYANPDAPKGGALGLAAEGGFDSLNPFILSGTAADGVLNFTFESLLTPSRDEPDAAYGLLAEGVALSVDRRAVRFRLRAAARWHDGTPVTADDVVFSFQTLRKEGSPTYRILYEDVLSADAIDPLTVEFRFRSIENRKLPFYVGTMPIFSKAYYATHVFNRTTLEPPLGSGPYRIERVDEGRGLVYRRIADYWGADLAVNRGRFNFDTIRIDYFRDRTVMVEAFKAGAYDWHEEFTAKTWATAYNISEIADGRIVRAVLPDNTPSGIQAFFINTRRPQFRDARVRLALDYAFDFEWTNKALFYGQYQRTKSYFENSELAAQGSPSPAEQALLEPYQGQLPAALFDASYEPASTDGSGDLRANLQKAVALFTEAGWTVRDGKLVEQASGQPMTIEFLYVMTGFERVLAGYRRNLERLGISVSLRLVDPAQYEARLKNFDFDLIIQRYQQELSPGAELRSYFGSRAADEEGSRNLAGIKDKVVDTLIERVVQAADRPALIAASRALDRALLFGHYMVPQWYKPSHNILYWNRFGRPPEPPPYDLGLDCWWFDAARAAALKAGGKPID